jgi:hypothetical protein
MVGFVLPCGVARGIDAPGARGDFQRHYGANEHPYDEADQRTADNRDRRGVCWVGRESGGLKSLQRSDEGRCIQRQG